MPRLSHFMAFAVAWPGVALADWSPPQIWQPSLHLGAEIAYRDHAAAMEAARGNHQGVTTQSQAAKPDAGLYNPDLKRRRSNLAGFVAEARRSDPAAADSLAALFAEGDVIERMKPLVGGVGLDTARVADAYALYWFLAWNAARGANPDPTRRQMDAIKAQAAAALGATPLFVATGDPERQNMAEAIWIQTLLLDGAVDQAKADPAMLQAVGKAARQGALATGFDTQAVNLTDEGFVRIDG